MSIVPITTIMIDTDSFHENQPVMNVTDPLTKIYVNLVNYSLNTKKFTNFI